MILVFGGTTEGRAVVKTLDESGTGFYYSTRGDMQHVEAVNMTHLHGAMDCESMETFCRERDIRCIVDASHPFAAGLRDTIAAVASRLGIPVIRYERIYSCRGSEKIIWCDDYRDAVRLLEENGVESLLALTGVQTIVKLKPYWERHRCVFRILDRGESWNKAEEAGFPLENIVTYSADSDVVELIDRFSPDAMITKESGESGGFDEKLAAACERNIPLYVVRRPMLPEWFVTVTGPYGLRRAVEANCPGFFKLRSGLTTGSCATAAATAAIMALKLDEEPEKVDIILPDGETIAVAVSDISVCRDSACATVVKDGGDDPDVTHGREISVSVAYAAHDDIRFFAGEGVGTVTLPGLGLEPGEPAINPVPRRMMENALRRYYSGGLDVTVSVPGGAELAARTFNPKLGIKGGISIIGTSGIVRPFSNEAFIESLRREMEVARAIGCRHIVVNSGARSERFVKAEYPAFPAQAFIHYGNSVGEAMSIASQLGFERLTIGFMIGKAVKLAEGNVDTHSRNVTLNHSFLADVARDAGCSMPAIDTISHIVLARELWGALTPDDANRFFSRILELCHDVCKKISVECQLESMLISDSGEISYRINEFAD